MTSYIKIALSTIYLTLATIANAILGIFRQFFIASMLDPSQFGIWNLIRTFLGYANYSDFGANTGVLYEAPKHLGREQYEQAKEIRQQGFLFVLGISIILSFLVFSISFLPFESINNYSMIIRLSAVSILVFSLINFYNVEARIVGNFKILSMSMVIAGTVSLIFTVFVPMFIKENIVEWVAIAWLGGMFLSMIYLAANLRISALIKPNSILIRKILIVGFPLSLIPVVVILFRTADRWILTSVTSAIDFGYYAFGVTIGMFLYTIPSTLGVVLSTRLIKKYGATGNPATSSAMVTVSLLVSSYGMAFITGGVIIGIPFLLNNFLHSYLPGEDLIKIVIVANCVLFALPVTSNFLLSIERKKIVFAMLASMIVLEILLAWMFGSMYGVYGGALAILFVSLVGGVFFLISTFIVIKSNISEVILDTLKTILPFFILIAISLYIDDKVVMGVSVWEDLKMTMLYEIYYICLAVPVALLFFWLSKTANDIRNIFKAPSIT